MNTSSVELVGGDVIYGDPFLDLCAFIFVLPRKSFEKGESGNGVRYLKWGGMFFPSSVFE